MPETLQILHYEYVPDMVEKRKPHREAHLDLIKRCHGDDRLVMAGAVGDPPYGGLLVFRSAERRRVLRRRGPLRRRRAGGEVVGGALDGGHVMWERLASLPLEVEGYTLEKLQGGERVTTLLRLQGGGQEGVGEDVMQDPRDPFAEHDAFAAQAPLPLAGSWTLESFCDHLATLEQWEKPPEWGDFARRLRNWVYESAALDLALRQAGVPLHEALGLEPRPLTFVNSLGLGDDPSTDTIDRRLELYPSVGFKLDAAPNWSPEIIETLAGTGMVRTIDFKGRYGLEVADEARARRAL